MMKKIFFILLLTAFTMSMNAQLTVDKLMDKYKGMPHAEYVNVPKMMMNLAKTVGGPDIQEANEYMKCIHSVKVLDMEDCSPSVKKQFADDVKQLKLDGYEEMVRVSEDGEQTLILTKGDEKIIREMLIVDASKEDATIVMLKGKMKQSDMEKIIKDQTKN